MKPTALSTLVAWAGGELLSGDPDAQVSAVGIDSRNAQAGQLFVAIQGDRFDGHDFLPQVDEARVAAVLISRQRIDSAKSLKYAAVIAVDDTLVGIQNLAKGYRESLDIQIVGITGSNGKTSTKDLVSMILGQQGAVFATPGNLNNHLGVPLTLLSLEEHHRFGVVEMGMNHFGEILPLVEMAQPDVGIITNIGVAHIEHMGSQAGIAEEKGVLLAHLKPEGVAVVPAEDDFRDVLLARSSAKAISAGIDSGEVQARDLRATERGTAFTLVFGNETSVEVNLPILGRHMVQNAALAAAAGWSLGLSPELIATALNQIVLTHGRLELKPIGEVCFVDDSYNANPDSMKAALKTLAEMKSEGRKIAVLGRMGELGIHTEANHREMAHVAQSCGLDTVFTVGHEHAALISEELLNLSNPTVQTQHFSTHEEAAEYLKTYLSKGDIILLKGSRSAAMEKVLKAYITP